MITLDARLSTLDGKSLSPSLFLSFVLFLSPLPFLRHCSFLPLSSLLSLSHCVRAAILRIAIERGKRTDRFLVKATLPAGRLARETIQRSWIRRDKIQ
jgi:hypothetical protein